MSDQDGSDRDGSTSVSSSTVPSTLSPFPALVESATPLQSSGQVPVRDRLVAVVGGPDHGLWHATPSGAPDRVTDWIAWRPYSVTRLPPGERQTLWGVEVVDARMRRYRFDSYRPSTSLSPAYLAKHCLGAVTVPPTAAGKRQVRIMLEWLGATDRKNYETPAPAGWTEIDGRTIYLPWKDGR